MSALAKVIEMTRHPYVSMPSPEWVAELQHIADEAEAELAALRADKADLLEALELLASEPDPAKLIGFEAEYAEAINKARAAIAKAKGE